MSCIDVKFAQVGTRRLLSMTITDKNVLKGLPTTAKLKVRLAENKLVEVVEFGTISSPGVSGEFKNTTYTAPSCQFRIVADDDKKGLLLASTDNWTLTNEGSEAGAEQGILLFLPADIAPRVWKLNIRSQEHPLVYVDRRIPQAKEWARTDPIFVGSVMPTIVAMIFRDILLDDSDQTVPWIADWIRWADMVMPGDKPPFALPQSQKDEWIERLIETFAHRHQLLEKVVGKLLRAQVNELPRSL